MTHTAELDVASDSTCRRAKFNTKKRCVCSGRGSTKGAVDGCRVDFQLVIAPKIAGIRPSHTGATVVRRQRSENMCYAAFVYHHTVELSIASMGSICGGMF